MRRWTGWVFGVFIVIGVLLGTAVVLPFLIDFDKFKPQIQQAVSEKLNAKVDFKSARLTILTGLGVRLKNVTIENTDPTFAGTRLFAVKDVTLYTELRPLLKKKLVGTLVIDKPEIVFARVGLKNNLASLPKETANKPEEKPKPEEKSGKPSFDFQNAVVIKKFKIDNASFVMRDLNEKVQEPVRVQNLNLLVTNIGVNRDVQISLSTKLDVKQSGMSFKGPLALSMVTRAALAAEKFQSATFQGKLDFDKLDMNVRNAFLKPAGVPLNLGFNGSATDNSLSMDTIRFVLHTLSADAKVRIGDFKSLPAQIQLGLEDRNIQSLGDLLPQHKHLLQNGALSLQARVNGPLKDLSLVSANASLLATLTGSDVAFKVDMASLQPAKGALSLMSHKLDVGALLKPFAPTEKQREEKAQVEAKKEETKSEKPASEIGLTAEQKKLLQGMRLSVKTDIGDFRYGKIALANIHLSMNQDDLLTKIDRFALNGFGAAVDFSGGANLAPNPPHVQARLSVTGGKVNVSDLLQELGIKNAGEKATAAPQEPASTTAAPAVRAPEEHGGPAKDFELTSDQKRLLQGVDAAVALRLESLTYNKLFFDRIAVDADVKGLLAAVRNFSLRAFDGDFRFGGQVDLASSPIAFKANTALQNIRIEKLIEFVKPEHKELLTGIMSLQLPVDGKGTTVPTLSQTLNGKGTFALKEGVLHTASLTHLAQTEFDKFVQGLSVVAAADNVFKTAEKMMSNPLAQTALANKNLDIGRYKQEYEKIRNVRITEKAVVTRPLRDVTGSLEIKQGRVYFTAKNATPEGNFDFIGSIGLDQSLQGAGVYTFSPKVKQEMLAQSKHSSLLFDQAGNLTLDMKIGGTAVQPTMNINFAPIRERFVRNAQALVEKEVRKQVDDAIQSQLKGRADAAAAQLRAKIDAERKRAEDEAKKRQAELNKAADDARKKAEDEANRQKNDASKKAKDEAKKLLKGMFGK